MKNVEEALKPVRGRIRVQRTVEWAAVGLCVGMLGALLLRAASFLWPFPTVLRWSALTLAGAPLLCALVAWLWPISAIEAARKADQCGLQARAQTALMLKDSDTPMADMQRRDALKHLDALHLRQAFPAKLPRFCLLGMAACAVCYGLSYFIPNPQQSVLESRAAFQQKMTEQAALVDDGAVKLDAKDEQTPELRRVLGDLSLELRKSETPRAALSAADEAERRIESLQNATRESLSSALQANGMSDLAQALESGDEEAAQRLLDQQEQRNAAAALNAAAFSAIDDTAANALSAAAQAMQAGNGAAALASLQNAAQGLSAATVQAAALSAMVRAAAANAGALMTGTLTAAGMAGSGAQGLSGLSATGNGGTGVGAGTGKGNGTGAGTGSSDRDGGYQNASGKTASTAGSQDPALKVEDYEAIYDPTRLNRSGDTVTASGKTGEGDVAEITAGTGLGSADGSVPYVQALGDYEQAAVTAAQNADLPPYARQWVQDYFSALAQ